MLTGETESIITLPNRGKVSEGRLVPLLLPEPHHTRGRPPLANNAGGQPAGVEHAQPRPASPAPSESSIAEAVFDARLPTPCPPPPPQVSRRRQSQDDPDGEKGDERRRWRKAREE